MNYPPEIVEFLTKYDRIILAWGNHKAWRQQDLYALELLKNHTHLYSLGITKKGCPRHPLYLRSTIEPVIYDVATLIIKTTIASTSYRHSY